MNIQRRFKMRELEGRRLPNFYGVAYVDYQRGEVVCYPLFINVVVHLWNEFIWCIKDLRREVPRSGGHEK